MDEPLLDRYRVDQSPQAAARLIEAFSPLVYSVCRRYLRRAEDVDDAAQETFLKLLKHAGSIQQDLAGWLSTTAHSTSIDLIRRATSERRRRQSLETISPARLEHRLLHEAISQKLHEALLQLDPAARELVVERFMRKTPLRVIAAQQRVSMATVSRQVSRAVADLAGALRDLGVKSADEMTLAEHFGDSRNVSDVGEGLRFAPDWTSAAPPAPPSGDPQIAATFLPGWTRPLRVGIFVSHLSLTTRDPGGKSHAAHADGWAVREAWLQIGTSFLMLHPGIAFIGIVEPGTSHHGPIEGAMRDYELLGGLIDATDVEALETLDVILLGNNWVLTPQIASAFHAAVRSGVGLLNDCCWTDLFGRSGWNQDLRALSLAASPVYRFHTTPEHNMPMPAIIHEAHPVLPGLRPGMEATVPGCGPVYAVMPGAKVLMSRDVMVPPQQHQLPGVGALRPPVYVVGQLGQGRVVVVNVHAHRRIMLIPGVEQDYITNLLLWLAEPRARRIT